MNERPPRRITPARPDSGDDSPGYLPTIPWRWIALGALTLSIVGFSYIWNERSKAQALRAGILRLHSDTLGEASERYVSFRNEITKRTVAASRTNPRNRADRQLKISGLRGTPGLYLRVPRDNAREAEGLAKAAARATPDVIATCMGLQPLSARGLFEHGGFLLPDWVEEARVTDSVLRLRVIDDELARRVKRDLPSVLTLLQSRWFLLVLEHGPRDRMPVDVFLWDLREDEPLLEARIRSRGVLMSARVRTGTSSPAPKLDPNAARRSGAHDCSIGAQIKDLAGLPAVEVTNQPAATDP